MIDHEVYDLTQTGQQVQNILDKGEALPTNQQLQQYLAAKQDKLTFDNVPVRGSDNPITSGAVYDATTEEYEGPVTELPQAGADTMHKIYLVGEEGATTYDRYYTSFDGTTYSWVPMGSTQINLSGKADKLGSGHTDKVATFNNNGNLKDSGIAVADVESSIVYDISRANAVGDVLTKYADLEAALDSNNGGGVPESLQKGGMSVKFVQSSDNKYVQYRLMAQTFSTVVTQWQGVDDEPTAGSENLVKSGGVAENISETKIDFRKNLIVKQGEAISTSGNRIQSGSYSHTDKVYLNKIVHLDTHGIEIYKGNTAAGMAYNIPSAVFFDAQGNVVGYYESNVPSGKSIPFASIPNNAESVIFNTLSSTSVLSIANYGYNYLYDYADNTEFDNSETLVAVHGKAITTSGNTTTASSWHYTKKIILKKISELQSVGIKIYKGFITQNMTYNIPSAVFYDSLGNVVGYYESNVSVNGVIPYSSIPNNAESVTFNMYTSSASPVLLIYNYGQTYCFDSLIKDDSPILKSDKTVTSNGIAESVYLKNPVFIPNTLQGNGSLYYENTIDEIYINPSKKPDLSQNQYLSLWCSSYTSDGNTYYSVALSCASGDSTATIIWIKTYGITNAVNNDVIKLRDEGYIVFKDIDNFKAHTYGNPVQSSKLNLNRICNLGLCPKINDYIINQKIPEQQSLEIQIPPVVYAVVGVELNIWNDCVSLSADRGLSSPLNYKTEWHCNKGLVTERGFRYVPQASDVGNVSCTCTLTDMQDKQLSTKTFTIKVLAKDALSNQKNIIYFGDSIGSATAINMYNDFNDSTIFTGVAPVMLGTHSYGDIKYEAVGGYRWADYATAGRRAFRCQVSGVGTIALQSKYRNNGFTWTVVEVNVTEGVGNILITKDDSSGTDTPETNGVLVPLGGGTNIPYTDATLQGANPLWNNETGKLDISKYKTLIGLSDTDKIDAVSFELGLNASGDTATNIIRYITDLYNAFIEDNPDCLFILALVTQAGNTADGCGANYGTSYSPFEFTRNYYRERNIYLSFLDKEGFDNLRIATPNLSMDRYYGFPFGVRDISSRFEGISLPDGLTINSKEIYHTNFVHPNTSGFKQLADSFFAAYIGVLTE